MAGYAKIHQGIIHSSVWRSSKEVRILWIALLSQVDKDGLFVGSVGGMAAMAGLTEEETRAALRVLTSPDPDSTSKAEEGRRVVEEEIEGRRVWRVVTHAFYRRLRSIDEVREKAAERQAKKRQRDRATVTRTVTESHVSNDIAEARSKKQEAEAIPPKPPSAGASKDAKITLPDDWDPTEDCIARIVKGSDQAKGCTAAFASMCVDRFVDYFTTAGKGGSERRTAQKWQDRFKLWVWDNWKRAEGDDYRRANGIAAPTPTQKMDI